jgi:cytoskeletal protein RodZ
MQSGAGATPGTVGPLLKEARSAKGLTIEAAASASKISTHLIRLMEEQQFHLVPDPVYIIRFLAEYAGFLGLDPKQVETQFRRQIHQPGSIAPLQPVATLRSRIGTRRPRLRRRPSANVRVSTLRSKIGTRRLVLYLLSAVAAVPMVFVILSLFAGRPAEPPPPPEPTPPAAQEVATQPPQAPAVEPSGPREMPADADRPSHSKGSRSAIAPVAQAPQGKPPRHTLRAEARTATWIAVSVDGSTKREVTLHPGGTAHWSARHGFVVSIGDAEGIALYLNGKPVTLAGGRGRVIQNLPLAGDREPAAAR